MTELLRVYEDIYSFKQEYCVICLRSARERRLVDAKNLELFGKSVSLNLDYKNFQRLCWVCERAAVAALRLRIALRLSGAVHGLFDRLDREPPAAKEELTNKLRAGTYPAAARWQAQVRRLRARSALLRTEVLLVASVPPAGDCASSAGARPAPDEFEVRDEPPLALSEPEIYLDSVIIEDDERDPIEIKHEQPAPDEFTIDDTPPHATPPHDTPQHATPRQDTSQDASQPMLDTLLHSPASTVTIDKLLADSNNTSTVTIDKLLADSNNTSFVLHPIIGNNDAMFVPSLNAQIVNGQLMTLDNSQLVLQTPRLALHYGQNFDIMTEPTAVTRFLKGITNNNLDTASIVSELPFHVLKNNGIEVMQTSNAQSQSASRATSQNVATSQVSASQVSASQVSARQVSASQVSANQVSANQVSANQVSASQVLASQDFQTLMNSEPFSGNNIMTHSILIDDDDIFMNEAEMRSDSVRVRQGDTDGGRRKRDRDKVSDEPPKKPKETDWEDKIPMDVISYVGAVDPNANPLLRGDSPLGVISSVHSLTNEDDGCGRTGIHSAGINSVPSGINSAPSGINSVQYSAIHNRNSCVTSVPRINSAQTGISNIQTGISCVQTGTSYVQSGIMYVRTGTNIVQAGIKDVSSGINSAKLINKVTQISSKTRVQNKSKKKGVQRATRVSERADQNKLPRGQAGAGQSEVIDLC